METSSSSLAIVILLWLLGIGIFNVVYLVVTKKLKQIEWSKFIVSNIILLVLYLLVNFLSIAAFSGGGLVAFGITNLVLLFGAGLLGGLFVLKEDNKNAFIYALLFAGVFNLLWYRVVGAL